MRYLKLYSHTSLINDILQETKHCLGRSIATLATDLCMKNIFTGKASDASGEKVGR